MSVCPLRPLLIERLPVGHVCSLFGVNGKIPSAGVGHSRMGSLEVVHLLSLNQTLTFLVERGKLLKMCYRQIVYSVSVTLLLIGELK